MRRLGYGLLVFVLLLAVVPVASVAWRRWETWRNLQPARNAGLDERILFEARGPRALEFNVSTHQGWFALQGFAVAPPARRAQSLPVTVEVALHGARGVTRERRYLALPAVTRAQPYGLLDGNPRHAVWVLPTEWIDLSGRPDVRSVSVRLVEAGPGVETVLWRGAIDERLSDTRMRLRYRRLSEPAREALTASWITPPALVEPAVKQELLRFQQRRTAPLGQPGETFAARRVLRHNLRSAPRTFAGRPGALAISPSLDVTVDLDATREVVIDARRADGAPLGITVEGPGPGRRTGINGRWRGTWSKGLHVVRSPDAGTIDIRDADSGDSLLPSGLRPRTRRASADRVLRYQLFALGEAPPPVRVRLRPERGTTMARLQFIDSAGAATAIHEIQLPWRASRFDRLAADADRAVAEAVQVDLHPPATAQALHVEADAPMLVHVLTTIPDAARGARWYSFQPDTDARSAASQGIVVIEQPRPQAVGAEQPEIRKPPPLGARAAGGARTTHATPRTVERDRPRLRLRPARREKEEDRDAD